jgi:hypothetical protein
VDAGEIIIYSATLEYSARSKSIDILPNSYIAMALYCNLYGRPRKRMKVRTSPNSKFVDIVKIRRAQLAAGEGRPEDEDEEEANKSDSTLDCILIE